METLFAEATLDMQKSLSTTVMDAVMYHPDPPAGREAWFPSFWESYWILWIFL